MLIHIDSFCCFIAWACRMYIAWPISAYVQNCIWLIRLKCTWKMYMYRSVLELLSCSLHKICTCTKVYKCNWVVVYTKMYMYIKYELSDFVYDFVHAKIRTCTKVYYAFIRKCTADIGHRSFLQTLAKFLPLLCWYTWTRHFSPVFPIYREF